MFEFNEKKFDFNDSFSKINISLPKEFESRYIKPPKTKDIPYKKLKYQKAEEVEGHQLVQEEVR